MGGSSSFWPGSSICLYSRLQFLPRPKRNDPTGGNGDLFSGLWVTSWPFTLLAQIEIAETRQLHLLVALERGADFLEEELDDFLRFALVEPELLEQTIGDLCLRQRAHVLESPRMSGCPRRRSPLGRSPQRRRAPSSLSRAPTAAFTRPLISGSVRVREASWKVKPTAMLFSCESTSSR